MLCSSCCHHTDTFRIHLEKLYCCLPPHLLLKQGFDRRLSQTPLGMAVLSRGSAALQPVSMQVLRRSFDRPSSSLTRQAVSYDTTLRPSLIDSLSFFTSCRHSMPTTAMKTKGTTLYQDREYDCVVACW